MPVTFSSIPEFVHVSGRLKYFGGIYRLFEQGRYYKRIFVEHNRYIYKHHGRWALHKTLNSSKPLETSPGDQPTGFWSGQLKIKTFRAHLPTQTSRVTLKYDQPWGGEYSRLEWSDQNGTLDWFKHNGQPVYRKSPNITYLYMNSLGVWLIGNNTLSDAGTQVVSFNDWTEWTEIESNVLVPGDSFDPIREYFDLPHGARQCLDIYGSPMEPIGICDNKLQCRRGADEVDCPFFVNLKFWIPLVFTLAVVVCGLIIWKTLEYCSSGFFVKYQSESVTEDLTMDKSANNEVDKVIEHILENKAGAHSYYSAIRCIDDKPSDMKLLIETGFTLLADPFERHRLAQMIFEHYEQKYGENEKEILSKLREIGSNGSIQALIECRSDPGCLVKLKFKLVPILDFVFTLTASSYVFPVLKVYMFLLDYVKDTFLLRFIMFRTRYLSEDLYWMIHYTSFAHGASIVLAASVIGFYMIYIDYFKISKISSKCTKGMLGLMQILFSPVLPVVIILQAGKIEVTKRYIIAKWRISRSKSPTEVFLKLFKLEKQNEKIARIYSDFKLIEMNIEAIPQMMCLVVYTT